MFHSSYVSIFLHMNSCTQKRNFLCVVLFYFWSALNLKHAIHAEQSIHLLSLSIYKCVPKSTISHWKGLKVGIIKGLQQKMQMYNLQHSRRKRVQSSSWSRGFRFVRATFHNNGFMMVSCLFLLYDYSPTFSLLVIHFIVLHSR